MFKHISLGQLACLVLSLLLLVLAYVGYQADKQETTSQSMTVPLHKTGIDPLMPDRAASQTFTARENDFSSLEAMVSNYNKKLKAGTMTLWVTDSRGQEIGRITVETAGIKNNAFVTVPLTAVQTDSEGKSYTLYATAEGVDQKGITLRSGPVPDSDGTLVLTRADGITDTENAMYLRLNYTHTIYGIMAGMTLLLLAVCFAACIPFAGKERTHG